MTSLLTKKELNKIVNRTLNPAKYNGVQLDKKYFFSIDYLVFNLKGKPKDNAIDLTRQSLNYGSRTFAKLEKIIYKNIDFGVLASSPNSSVIDEDLCQLKLSNHLFYMYPLADLKKMVKRVFFLLGLKYSSVSRLDTALDFLGDMHNIEPTVKLMQLGFLKLKGRSKKQNFYTKINKGVSTITGFDLGSRTGLKMLRCYNKTLEMKTQGFKEYIHQQWKNNDMLNNGDIWRFEYQFTQKYLKSVNELDFENLFNKDFLFTLFVEANKNFFELVLNTGKKEVNKEKLVSFFNWSEIAKIFNVVKQKITRLKRTIKETLIGQQRLIKALFRSYASSGQDIEYIIPLKRILNDFALNKWFHKKRDLYIDEFIKKEMIQTFDIKQFKEDIKIYI